MLQMVKSKSHVHFGCRRNVYTECEAREWFLRKTEVSGESSMVKTKISTIDAKLATNYDLEHQLCSVSTRPHRLRNPGGYPEMLSSSGTAA